MKVSDEDRELLKTLIGGDDEFDERVDKGLSYTAEVEMIAAHRQAGIREGIEMAAKVAEEWFPGETASTYPKGGVVASIRALAGGE